MKEMERWRAARRGATPPDPPPDQGALASLARATGWLDSAPLTARGLSGSVVLVDFWTYTCINWLRTMPYRVGYPVAIDNDYAIWTSFDNHYWPALYLVDAGGQIRHHHFGEGGYEQSEATIQRLLTENGARSIGPDVVRVDATGVEAAADWENLWSPENYLGSDRTENFASRNGAVLGTHHVYAAPPELRLNEWALSGDWTITRQAIHLNQADGLIAYRFHARDLHLVMAPTTPGGPIRFRVRVDGQPPGAAHGIDVDEHGNGTVNEPRLYQLVRQPGPIAAHTFEIVFLDPGVRAYAFTFG